MSLFEAKTNLVTQEVIDNIRREMILEFGKLLQDHVKDKWRVEWVKNKIRDCFKNAVVDVVAYDAWMSVLEGIDQEASLDLRTMVKVGIVCSDEDEYKKMINYLKRSEEDCIMILSKDDYSRVPVLFKELVVIKTLPETYSSSYFIEYTKQRLVSRFSKDSREKLRFIVLDNELVTVFD